MKNPLLGVKFPSGRSARAVALATAFAIQTPAMSAVMTDFSWVPAPGMPAASASTTLSDGTLLTLSSTPALFERLGVTALVRLPAGETQTGVTLSFDRDLDFLSLAIADLDVSETLDQFVPALDSVTGDFQLLAGVVSSPVGGGSGEIVWTSVSANSFAFDYKGLPGLGIRLRQLTISDAAAAPVPGTAMLLTLGMGLVSLGRRRK
jgi:hypothetical protein